MSKSWLEQRCIILNYLSNIPITWLLFPYTAFLSLTRSTFALLETLSDTHYARRYTGCVHIWTSRKRYLSLVERNK